MSQRYQKRNGGYCRVIRAGFRYGDSAPLAVIELVDRDFLAKKVDIKKDKKNLSKTLPDETVKSQDKKTKSKK